MLKKPLIIKKEDLKAELKFYFNRARNNLREKHRRRSKKHKSSLGIELCRERAELNDEIIIKSLECSRKEYKYGMIKDIQSDSIDIGYVFCEQRTDES